MKQKLPTHIFVGSTNPVKVNAVRMATADHWPNLSIVGLAVPSGVAEQPRSDEETLTGAQNRAQAVLKLGLAEAQTVDSILGLGLEGGVFTHDNGELWSTVWVSVVDSTGVFWNANGARFKVPQKIAQPIEAGQEMGAVLSQLFDGANIKQQNGAIGVVTKNFVTRTDEYAAICKLAIGLWYGEGWDRSID